MKTKIFTLALCMTGILVQNIQAQTTSETISKEEAIEFWTAFKKLCKEKDTVNIARFVTDTIIQEITDESLATIRFDRTLQEAKKELTSGSSETIVPYWLENMQQVELDKPAVTEGNNEWGFKVDKKNPNQYIHWYISPNGEGSCLEMYYFKKVNGIIKYYKRTVTYY